MMVVGWTIVFLAGLAFINVISFEIKPLEKLGFALPIGLGIATFLMMGFEAVGLPLNSAALLLGSLSAIGIASAAYSFAKNKERSTLLADVKGFKIKSLLPINMGWLVLMACIAVVVYTNVTKTVFWPVIIHDSINGYDFLAKVIFAEGSFNNSIFDPNYPLYSVRSLYPPFTPLSFSISYLFGHDSSKIINAILYASNAVVFYSLLTRYSGHLAAALFSLLFVITPEFAAFSALSSPNPICTFYSAMGMLTLFIWYKEGKNSYFYIGLLCIVLALWTRSEAIIFFVGGGFLMLLKAIKDRSITKLLLFTVSCLAVFISWRLYLKYGIAAEHKDDIISYLYWDYDKLARMMGKVRDVTLNTQFYGILVYLFLAMVAANAYFTIRYKEGLALLGAIIIPWLAYIFIYYQLDEAYMPTGGTAYIQSGYKRGIFYFFPLLLFYCANNRIAYLVFNKWLKL